MWHTCCGEGRVTRAKDSERGWEGGRMEEEPVGGEQGQGRYSGCWWGGHAPAG